MENNNLIHTMDSKEVEGMSYVTFFTLVAVAVIIGTVLSFSFSRFNKKTSNINGNNKTAAQSAGVVDKKTFKDSAEGLLREGGIDGEGNFHLERPGGVSQNVYLTSTTVDLSNYIGKKVKVWGQTFQAEKAGWLMDVGSVEM